ncbi:MAG: 2-dehydropantoate 2-reductase [Candidatus Rokubacteria bacterium]|nr:2-dehydropantoate 2-reductase [Candidatus Rokubacteria bacterium]
MRIAVMGAGGMGGYFGGRLARAGEAVAFVARGEHLRAIQGRGLTVRSVAGDFSVTALATDDPRRVPELIGPVDLVLFCVKSYDTEGAAEALRPFLGPDTAVLTLQNGVVNEETLARRLGPERVLGGLVYGFAVIDAPGVIHHTQGGQIIFGELDGTVSPRASRFLEAGRKAGFPIELSTDVRRALWEKYLQICALSGMTCLARRPIGEIRACAESRRMHRMILEELAAIAEAEGVGLADDVVERGVAAAEALKPDSYSSLYHDLTRGRRLELEALQGHAVRLGARHGIPTPALFAVYAALRPAALAAERAA